MLSTAGRSRFCTCGPPPTMLQASWNTSTGVWGVTSQLTPLCSSQLHRTPTRSSSTRKAKVGNTKLALHTLQALVMPAMRNASIGVWVVTSQPTPSWSSQWCSMPTRSSSNRKAKVGYNKLALRTLQALIIPYCTSKSYPHLTLQS